ncbi:MAG: phage portal protein [Planctomycetota bacterium]
MSIINALREKFATVIYPVNRIGDPTQSMTPMSEATAMGIPAFFSGVSFLALTLATLPVHVLRKTDNGREKANDHDLKALLGTSPSELNTAAQFWETLFAHAVSWGNGYALVKRDRSGKPTELLNVAPHLVVPTRVNGRTVYALRAENGGEAIPVLARDMFHLPGLGYDGMQGYNPVRLLAESLQLGRAAQKFGTAFFANGARLGGVIESDKRLTDEQAADIKRVVEHDYSGPEKAGKWLVLQGGAKAKTLSAPPETAQLIETLNISEHQVCQILRVPPIHVYDFGRATWGNAVEMDRHTVQYSLRPWIIKAEQECRRKLLTAVEREQGYYVQFSVDGLLRGDPKTRMEVSRLRLGEGLTNIDEEREMDDRPVLNTPWSKAYRVPANSMSAEKLVMPAPADFDGTPPTPPEPTETPDA